MLLSLVGRDERLNLPLLVLDLVAQLFWISFQSSQLFFFIILGFCIVIRKFFPIPRFYKYLLFLILLLC